MKIISWNVNSIHVRLPRVTALLARHQPDLACLQEIKTSTGEFPAGDFAAVGCRAAVHGQAGRNGVAVLSRATLTDVASGFADHPGAHYCLGAPLARIELQAVFSRLPARFPTMRLAVPVEQLRVRSGTLTGGLTKLPVEW
jgi:exonuclease III